MKKWITLMLLFSGITLHAQKTKNAMGPNDIQDMLNLFAGEFDNYRQVHREREEGVKDVHEHIHSVFHPVRLPEIGPQVFYVYQYMDGDEKKVYRQRMYSFSLDKAENAIRLDIFSFKVDSLYFFSHKDTSKLRNLTMADLVSTDGCEVYWKRQGEAFIGYMKERACNFVSKRSGKRIFITDSLRLTKDGIWIRDEAEDENGNYVFGHKAKIPHMLDRCRWYTGWTALQIPEAKEGYEVQRSLRVHDKGGRIRLLTNDGKQTPYTLELAEVIYGNGVSVLKLAVYEEGKSKSVAYTWATPGSERIGINLRWLETGFTLATKGDKSALDLKLKGNNQ